MHTLTLSLLSHTITHTSFSLALSLFHSHKSRNVLSLWSDQGILEGTKVLNFTEWWGEREFCSFTAAKKGPSCCFSVAAVVIIAADKQLDDKKLEVKNKEDFFYCWKRNVLKNRNFRSGRWKVDEERRLTFFRDVWQRRPVVGEPLEVERALNFRVRAKLELAKSINKIRLSQNYFSLIWAF